MSSAPEELRIFPPARGQGHACRSLLDLLPAWFGIDEANDEYVEFVEQHDTWTAVDAEGNVIGLLAPAHHSQSAEIHLVAVHPSWHRRGVGRLLVDTFEADALQRGYQLAQVKTLGPSHPDEGYAATRRFYAALGYLELEEFADLWPGNPAVIMVKPLASPG